jgi:hypothetical protein
MAGGFLCHRQQQLNDPNCHSGYTISLGHSDGMGCHQRGSGDNEVKRIHFWFQALIAASVTIGVVMLISTVHAQVSISDPDSMTIESVRAYSGTINDGDMLVVIEYRIDYNALPSLAATDAFICRFFVDDLEVNASEIISFNDLGYGLGVCSMYFTEAELTAAGIEFENPNAEDYEAIVQGKPSAFADPPLVRTSSIDYRDDSQTMQFLQTDIANLAQDLENDAGWIANDLDLITFTTGQQVLTSIGEAYFGLAIPNLQIMIPDLFGTSTTSPEVFERDFGTSESDRLQTLWDASIFAPLITGMADAFHLSKVWILSLLGLGIIVLFFFVAKIETNDPNYAMLVVIIAFPLVIAAGFGSMVAVFFVAAIAVLGLMYVLFLRRAG